MVQSLANVACFKELRYSEHLRRARRGILNPSPVDLHPSAYAHLYRLGHSSLPDEENLSSPCWSDFQNFIALKRFAENNQVSLTISNRVNNAVAPAFGPADLLYTVRLNECIRVLQGLGRPIEMDGRIYSPPYSITQTYVPGLRDHGGRARNALGRKCLMVSSREKIGPGFISLRGE